MSEDSLNSEGAQHKFGVATPKRKMWGIPGGLLITLAGYLGPLVLMLAITPSIAPYLTAYSENLQNSVGQIVFQLMVMAFVVFAVRSYGVSLGSFGFGKFKLSYLQLIFIAFAIYFLLTVAMTAIADMTIGLPEEAQELGYTKLSGIEFIAAFVALCILTPIGEEMLFRGFLYKGLRTKLSFTATTIIVSLLFAVAHGHVGVAIDVFALSICLCYLRENTASLWPSIMLHSLKNSVAFFLLFIYNGPIG